MERPEAERVEEGQGHGPQARETLPVAPSMGLALADVRTPRAMEPVGRRVVFISAIAVVVALAAGLVRVRELVKRAPAVAYADSSLREAADLMVEEGVGRLPVVHRDAPTRVVGILTRSDLLGANRRRLEDSRRMERGVGGPRRTTAQPA
ncbi:hypothetical protein MFUL124B02_11335 [Myxococcus fulvus 124B02]|nr:hypothetical protein MFUL124B02_11335 [Myxococcus fulvus 124B02]